MIHRVLLRLFGLLATLASTPALALQVVATSPSMGALVKAVAGPRTKLAVLTGQNRDMHGLQAKPSDSATPRREKSPRVFVPETQCNIITSPYPQAARPPTAASLREIIWELLACPAVGLRLTSISLLPKENPNVPATHR